ncbi:hypothetical protein V5R22_01265 [Bacillus thuringiensis]|uniref:hypothetical protein n=1 Tax=Bacillus thuringiensis TaxID=1428 RepID=UPI003D5981A7
MLAKMKSWLKNEDSQLSSENGMLIALAVIIVLVIGPSYFAREGSMYACRK